MNQYEFTIGSPVLAAHFNTLLQRIASIAANCPSVSALTTVNVAGYSYWGDKIPPPGVGGFLPVISQVHDASSVLQVIAPAFIDTLPAETQNQRDQSVVGCSLKTWPIVGSGSGVYPIAPTYAASTNEAENNGPVAYVLNSTTTTTPGDQYTGNGVYLGSQETGSFGYEQDEIPLTAWITSLGIKTE